jgi:hypothetical protein
MCAFFAFVAEFFAKVDFHASPPLAGKGFYGVYDLLDGKGRYGGERIDRAACQRGYQHLFGVVFFQGG